MITCFETAGDCSGLPYEVSTTVVTWIKQLLEEMFESVPARTASSLSAMLASTSDEEEEEEEELVSEHNGREKTREKR